ncbi:MAG: glycosyltransferase family 2 protein [Promethearchaeota archaeon]
MNYPKVSIIILNWNGWKDTIECLESLHRITYPNYEVIVVDNGSKGNDADILEKEYGNYIRLIRSKKNLGFTGGNNLGVRKILEEKKSKYILLLNNDTIVDKNFLNFLVKVIGLKSNIAAVSPIIYYHKDPKKIWFSGGKIDFFRCQAIHNTKPPTNNYTKTNYISGCCFLIKSSFVDKNIFYPKYFAYCEDAELSLKLQKRGLSMMICKKSIIYHKYKASSSKAPHLIFYLSIRNRILLAKRNFPLFYLLNNCFYIILVNFPVQIFKSFFIYKDLKYILIFLKAFFDGLFTKS